jgi:hypothetical protein
MEPITDHRSLIDELGGNKVVADTLPDCPPVRVGQWKIGNRIPVEYWPDIIAMAEAKGLSFVNSEWLMKTMRPRAQASSSEAA